jgi:signal transduction histidine kinase
VIPSVIVENMALGQAREAQQIMMNLIMNSIDAKGVHGTRDLVITSRPANDRVMLSASDTWTGRLSISRSIVESHGGQLWAAPNSPRGARFHVTLPTIVEANESAGGRSHGLHH